MRGTGSETGTGGETGKGGGTGTVISTGLSQVLFSGPGPVTTKTRTCRHRYGLTSVFRRSVAGNRVHTWVAGTHRTRALLWWAAKPSPPCYLANAAPTSIGMAVRVREVRWRGLSASFLGFRLWHVVSSR